MSTTPILHVDQTGGMNYTNRPHLIDQKQWHLVKNIRTVNDELVMVPNQLVSFYLQSASRENLLHLANLPSGYLNYGVMVGLTETQAFQVRSAYSKALVTMVQTNTKPNIISPALVGLGPFTTSAGANLGVSFTWTSGTSYRVYVTKTTGFSLGLNVQVTATISGVVRLLFGVITAVSTDSYITIQANVTQATVPNTVTDVDDTVFAYDAPATFISDNVYRRWGTCVHNNRLFFVNELNPVQYTDGVDIRNCDKISTESIDVRTYIDGEEIPFRIGKGDGKPYIPSTPAVTKTVYTYGLVASTLVTDAKMGLDWSGYTLNQNWINVFAANDRLNGDNLNKGFLWYVPKANYDQSEPPLWGSSIKWTGSLGNEYALSSIGTTWDNRFMRFGILKVQLSAETVVSAISFVNYHDSHTNYAWGATAVEVYGMKADVSPDTSHQNAWAPAGGSGRCDFCLGDYPRKGVGTGNGKWDYLGSGTIERKADASEQIVHLIDDHAHLNTTAYKYYTFIFDQTAVTSPGFDLSAKQSTTLGQLYGTIGMRHIDLLVVTGTTTETITPADPGQAEVAETYTTGHTHAAGTEVITSLVKRKAQLAPTARYVQIFYDHIVLGATNYNGNDEPWSVRWSNLKNYNGWEPGLATEADHYICTEYQRSDDQFAGITGMALLKNNLLIYTESAIFAMRYVGLPRVMQVDPVVTDYGNGFKYAVLALGNTHAFIDRRHQNFYVFDTNGVRPIGDPIKLYFFDDINPDFELSQRTWGYVDRFYSEAVWVYVSKVSTGAFDKAVVFNYEDKTWTVRDVPNIHTFVEAGRRAQAMSEVATLMNATDKAVPASTFAASTESFGRIWGGANTCALVDETASTVASDLLYRPAPVLETGDFIYGSLLQMKETGSMNINATLDANSFLDVEGAARRSLGIAPTFTRLGLWTASLVTDALTFVKKAGIALRYRFTPDTTAFDWTHKHFYVIPNACTPSNTLRVDMPTSTTVSNYFRLNGDLGTYYTIELVLRGCFETCTYVLGTPVGMVLASSAQLQPSFPVNCMIVSLDIEYPGMVTTASPYYLNCGPITAYSTYFAYRFRITVRGQAKMTLSMAKEPTTPVLYPLDQAGGYPILGELAYAPGAHSEFCQIDLLNTLLADVDEVRDGNVRTFAWHGFEEKLDGYGGTR